MFKRVCSHLDPAPLALSWEHLFHGRVAGLSAVCCIMFQVTPTSSGTSSSPGQAGWDIPVQYFLKESPKMLLNTKQSSIINEPPHTVRSCLLHLLQLLTTVHKTNTVVVINTKSLWFNQ